MQNTTTNHTSTNNTFALGIIGLAITLAPFVVVALLMFVPTHVK